MKVSLLKVSLPLAAVALSLSAPLPAQTSASASVDASATSSVQADRASASSASNVSAQLTSKLDSKNARAGDEVFARTTSSAKLADGTTLPKGSKLTGHITDVHARSSADNTAHLAFTLERATLRDGREIPIHAVLTSIAAPAAASTYDSADASLGGPIASGGGRASAGGGGLLGGAARSTGALAGSTAGFAANATGSVASTTGRTVQSTTSVAGSVNSATALQLDHVPVGNLPGVTFSTAADASMTTALDARGRNIALESGTQLALSLSAR